MILGHCFLGRPIIFINTSYNICINVFCLYEQFCIFVKQKEKKIFNSLKEPKASRNSTLKILLYYRVLIHLIVWV